MVLKAKGHAGAVVSKAEGSTGNVETISTAGNMAVSARGMELAAKYEGCRLEAYKCPVGAWTIGYGHTAGVGRGDRLPSREAEKSF